VAVCDLASLHPARPEARHHRKSLLPLDEAGAAGWCDLPVRTATAVRQLRAVGIASFLAGVGHEIPTVIWSW